MTNAKYTSFLVASSIAIIWNILFPCINIARFHEQQFELLIKVIKTGVLGTIVWFIVFYLLLNQISKKTLSVHLFSLVAIILCSLENSVLSIGLPMIDGDLDKYSNHARFAVDTAIWMAVFGVTVLLRKKLYGCINRIALSAILYALLLLPVELLQQGIPRGEMGNEVSNSQLWSSTEDVIASSRYSSDNNVIVLILDCFSSEIVKNIVLQNSDFRMALDGFVNFENNVGMHEFTQLAIPSLLTGKYANDNEEFNTLDYENSLMRDDSMIAKYIKNQCDVFYTSTIFNGRGISTRGRSVGTPPSETDAEFGNIALSQLTLFRTLPYCIKRLYLEYLFSRSYISEFIEHRNDTGIFSFDFDSGATDTDWTRYRDLSTIPVENTKTTLHVHHLKSLHSPYLLDSNGKKIYPSTSVSAFVERGILEFKRLSWYLSSLKDKGIFDTSTIIVLGDHSERVYEDIQMKNAHARAFPALMIKPKFSHEPFQSSSEPTSHAMIAAFLERVRSADTELSVNQLIQSLTVDGDRLYRLLEDKVTIDYNFNPDKSFTVTEKPIFRNPLRPVIVDRVYYFNSASPEQILDYDYEIYSGGGITKHDKLYVWGTGAELKFKAPDFDSFDITITGDIKNRYNELIEREEEFCPKIGSISSSKSEISILPYSRGKFSFTLPAVVPDNDGVIHIALKQDPRIKLQYGLDSISFSTSDRSAPTKGEVFVQGAYPSSSLPPSIEGDIVGMEMIGDKDFVVHARAFDNELNRMPPWIVLELDDELSLKVITAIERGDVSEALDNDNARRSGFKIITEFDGNIDEPLQGIAVRTGATGDDMLTMGTFLNYIDEFSIDTTQINTGKSWCGDTANIRGWIGNIFRGNVPKKNHRQVIAIDGWAADIIHGAPMPVFQLAIGRNEYLFLRSSAADDQGINPAVQNQYFTISVPVKKTPKHIRLSIGRNFTEYVALESLYEN